MDAVFFLFFISCKAGCKDPVWNEPVNLASLWDKSATGWYLYRLAALDPSMWADVSASGKEWRLKEKVHPLTADMFCQYWSGKFCFDNTSRHFRCSTDNSVTNVQYKIVTPFFTDAATQATVLVTDCPSPRVLKSMKNSVIFIQLEWMI